MAELLDFLRTHEEAFRSRARLASLYSDFRHQKKTNQDGYDANVIAWLRALSAAANAGLIPSQSNTHDRYTIQTGEELARALTTPEYGRPLALGAVIQDAVQKKELVPLRTFVHAKTSIYAKSWVPSPWQVIQWGLRQLGATGGDASDNKLVAGSFVIVANVEAAAKAVLDEASRIVTSNTSRIFSRELFVKSFVTALGVTSISETDMSVLLTHLSRDRSAVAYSPQTGTIKFASGSEIDPLTITEADQNIASIRTLMSSIEPQITQLQQQISSLDLAAKQAVVEKQLSIAKSTLRSKKLASVKLEQRMTTLTQLEDVYSKIELAVDQVEVVRVMEASSQALKSLNKQVGGVEKVQDIIEDLREEMANVDEVGQVLNQVSAGEVNEGEVEDELAELERVEREKREAIETKEKEAREAEEKQKQEKADELEAEQTRQRLAELEKIDLPQDVERLGKLPADPAV